jgi:hypothetical protein
VQVADDRHLRRHRGGSLVQRGEVMEIEDVRLGRARQFQLIAPGTDLPLEVEVVE